jgi:hypothetical protein
MFPGNAEAVARERHRDALREAEQWRLIKNIEAGQVNRPARLRNIIHWLGCQLVTLGLKLQGQNLPQSTQVVNPTSFNDANCSSL